MVCTTCYDKTVEVYKFIQMCNKAHEYMQHYLKNVETIMTKDETDVNVKIEEISIGPTSIKMDGRKFEEVGNDEISKFDEFEMVISGTEMKIEEIIVQEGMQTKGTSNNEEITISYTERRTEEKTDSSDMDKLRVEKIDPLMDHERIMDDHRQDAKRELSNALFETKYNLRSRVQRHIVEGAHISKDLLNQDRDQPLKGHETGVVCLEPQEMFTTKSRLNTHTQAETDAKPFKCLIYKRGLATLTSLRRHTDSHNAINAKATQLRRVTAHKCEQCDRRFTKASHLRSHMDIHNGVKAHKCEQCNRRFKQASNLRKHMLIHTGVKPHKCEECDRRFTRADRLRIHMNIHTGVKPHKCEQCDQRFTQASNLRTHMDIHNGGKAHKCEQCDWIFTQLPNLRRHINSHNGVKPHKCEQCDRRFNRADHLRIHMRKHNRVKVHICEQCDSPRQRTSAVT